jgi:hypothetical protein
MRNIQYSVFMVTELAMAVVTMATSRRVTPKMKVS